LAYFVALLFNEKMLNKCPQCGAQLPEGKQCRELFDQCLALEFEHPATFGKVHFLTVACYMLQHNAYSRVAWLEARRMLALYIQEGVSPTELRRRGRQSLDSGQRDWSVTKGVKLAEAEEIPWSRSIADVRLEEAEAYCADVEAWAKSVLEDTEFQE
jgi:uncharacterized protein YecE (DUF72 family)